MLYQSSILPNPLIVPCDLMKSYQCSLHLSRHPQDSKANITQAQDHRCSPRANIKTPKNYFSWYRNVSKTK